jgi:hypothetical protein
LHASVSMRLCFNALRMTKLHVTDMRLMRAAMFEGKEQPDIECWIVTIPGLM